MPDLLTPFHGAAGLTLGHAIIDVIGERQIPTSPANYEVWAAYKNGSHPALTHDINMRIARGEALSEEFCADLFETYFAKTRLSTQIFATSGEVAREIDALSADVRKAGQRAGAFAGDLEETATTLETQSDLEALRRTIVSLRRTALNMAEHNRVLEARMAQSSRQLDALQATLQDIRVQAVTDALTELANRRCFDEALNAEIASGHGFSLLLADIDHFKRVNDTWGHQVGDQVLRYVASVLKAHAGRGLAARYGGEEFAIIVPHAKLGDAHAIAERVRTTIKEKKLSRRVSGEQIGIVTISLGVAAWRPHEKASDLLARADACLYASKRAGRDRTTCDIPGAAVA